MEIKVTGVIIGTGSCLPEYVMSNDEIATFVDTSDEWITERTGIKERHICKEESNSYIAGIAAVRALESANVKAEEIDLIIVSTISPDTIMPTVASNVQKYIGADNAACMDLNVACSGFVVAYNTAMAYIESGIYKNILVVGSEVLSKVVDWTDRKTCILFGDGAGAVVISAAERPAYKPYMKNEYKNSSALTLEADTKIGMDGQAVFKFAVKNVAKAVDEILKINNVEKDEIDLIILHQANKRIIEAVSKHLSIELEKFPMNIAECGNTSSASIPLLLDKLNKENKLRKNSKIIFAGFGGGLSYAACIANW